MDPTQYERDAFLRALLELHGTTSATADNILKLICKRESDSAKLGSPVLTPFGEQRVSRVAQFFMRPPDAIVGHDTLTGYYGLSPRGVEIATQTALPWQLAQ